MKVIAVILVLAGISVAAVWWLGKQVSSAGHSVQIAFGEPSDTTIPMEMILTAAMASASPPDGDTRFGGVWKDWMNKHVRLTDASGSSLSCEYKNEFAFIGLSQGSPDVGYLRVNLKIGSDYILTYEPRVQGGILYRGKLRAPSARRSKFMLTLDRVDEQES